MTDLMQIASYVALAVLLVIAACWLWVRLFEYFSPEAKAERERINSIVAEQHRQHDEWIARTESDEVLAKANAELNAWRSRGLM